MVEENLDIEESLNAEIKSPCIQICVLKDDVCVGCHRTIQQIKVWRTLSNEQKKAIIKELETKV